MSDLPEETDLGTDTPIIDEVPAETPVTDELPPEETVPEVTEGTEEPVVPTGTEPEPTYRTLEDDRLREEEPVVVPEPEPPVPPVPEYWEDPEYVDIDGELTLGIKEISDLSGIPDGYVRSILSGLFNFNTDVNLRKHRITFRLIRDSEHPTVLMGKDYIRLDIRLYGKAFTKETLTDLFLASAKHLVNVKTWV